MTFLATFDFETYSEAGYAYNTASGQFESTQKGKPGISGVNAAVYAEHPSTRIISLAYDLGQGIKLWVPGCSLPQDLFEYIRAKGLIEAHNSGFEYYIWNYVCHIKMGWPALPLCQLRCSAAKARAAGLPGGLAKLTKVLNPSEGKDPQGMRLIRLLSIPKKPTKKCSDLYRSREKYPELYQEMYRYNIQDVAAEKAISAMMPELSSFEQAVWQLDQRINTRGVAVDTKGIAACVNIFKQAETKYTKELQRITNNTVQTVGEITKKSAGDKWLISQGVDLPSLDKATIKSTLGSKDWTGSPACRRVLEIRQLMGSANVKKLFAMQRTISKDGRLRDLFTYCGAGRTGRWSGRGPQPQNLKNSGPNCAECPNCGTELLADRKSCLTCDSPLINVRGWDNKATKAALKTIATGSLEVVERHWGNALDIIASCLRGLFIAAPGYDFICSDYSAIEARVMAVLAGEEWRLKVFRTHGKIYEASAAQVSNVSLHEIMDYKIQTGKHHPLRRKGKVRELALGYGGWISVMKHFGADKFMTDTEIKTDILAWRKESPAIVEFWGGQWRKEPDIWKFTPELYGLEGAAISALLHQGQCFKYRDISYGYDTAVDVLYCQLPSGRKLSYRNPRLTKALDPRGLEVWRINFKGWNSDSSKGPTGWVDLHTYGGRLAADCCQASARDIQASAMLRTETAGYPVVLHVHDETVAEIPKHFGSIEEFERLMMVREPWFADWPIKAADGWRGNRYRK